MTLHEPEQKRKELEKKLEVGSPPAFCQSCPKLDAKPSYRQARKVTHERSNTPGVEKHAIWHMAKLSKGSHTSGAVAIRVGYAILLPHQRSGLGDEKPRNPTIGGHNSGATFGKRGGFSR
jgi:hypothetical protein